MRKQRSTGWSLLSEVIGVIFLIVGVVMYIVYLFNDSQATFNSALINLVIGGLWGIGNLRDQVTRNWEDTNS